jgi:hypothetical protein
MTTHDTKREKVPKEPDRARPRPTSGAESPPIDTDSGGAEAYDDLFGTPALADADAEQPERNKINARLAGRRRARELVRQYGDDPQSLMSGIRQGLRIQYGIEEIRKSGGENR